MPGIHRHSDLRICTATTVVVGQKNVFANNLLVAVQGDPNTHLRGELTPINNGVYINYKIVVNNAPTNSLPDELCLRVGPPHCNPMTVQGSTNVFVGS